MGKDVLQQNGADESVCQPINHSTPEKTDADAIAPEKSDGVELVVPSKNTLTHVCFTYPPFLPDLSFAIIELVRRGRAKNEKPLCGSAQGDWECLYLGSGCCFAEKRYIIIFAHLNNLNLNNDLRNY